MKENKELCMKYLKAEKCVGDMGVLGEESISGKEFVPVMCLQVEIYQRK